MAIIASDPIIIDIAPETEPGEFPYSLSAPSLTALPGDGFAVAWTLHHPPVGGQSAESETFVSLYDSDGSQTAAPLVELPGGTLGNIAASTAGTIALMTGYGGQAVIVQVFDLAGNPIGEEQVVFDPGSGPFLNLPVGLAATSDGGYAAVWRWSQDAGPYASQLRIIGPDGEAAPTAIDIGEGARSTAQAVVASDGEIQVIAAIGEGDARYSAWFRFSEEGELLAEPTLIVTSDGERFPATDLDRLANGDFSVAMVDRTHRAAHFYPDRFLVQRVDGEGDPIGSAVEVSTPQRIETDPKIAPLQNGGFVAVWAQFQTGNLLYRVFSADGVALTDETTISNHGIETSLPFDITTLDDGRFVVTYAFDDDPSYSSNNGKTVVAQVFDHEPSRTATPGGTVAVVETWQDQLAITRDDDIDTLVTSDSLALKAFIANLAMAGTADLNADGNDMANFMIGNDGDNILVGYLGNDAMHGHDGNDFLAMGRGNDVADTGDGQNTVWGGQGDDSIQGGNGDDILNGDRHDDVIDGGAGDDRINGGSHDDLLTGAAGADSITGGTGADTLEGQEGADTLRGDRDDDRLEGGDGPDSFAFAHFFGNDTILDFAWAEDDEGSDRIVIEVDEDGTINGVLIQDAGDLFDLAADTGDGVLVTIGAGHSILLAGWEKADLTEDIFVLVV